MTGFGAADGEVAGGRLRLEIRSVNHRHLSVQLKVPSELSDAEGTIRERLRSHFDRGHVTVSGRWVEEPSRSDAVTVDVERARALVGALHGASIFLITHFGTLRALWCFVFHGHAPSCA